MSVYQRCWLCCLVVIALCDFNIVTANAQAYPSRPVHLIVPFAAGGLNDAVARLVQPYLEKSLGQPVIVENRPGAAGIVGTDMVAKAQPDGHTLLMVASSHTVIPATRSKLPYNAERDLAPVAMIGKSPLLFVVNAKAQAQSLTAFVALAKANPSKFNYATPGAASVGHLVAELFSRRAGISMQHLPYRGGAPAVMAVVTGDAQLTVVSPQSSLPQIQAGALRAIAAGSLVRDPQFADLPTVAESGFPGFEAIQWIGMLTTAGTPKNVIDRLNAELNRALRDPELIAKLAVQGIAPAGGTPAEYGKTISAEIRNWTETARAASITMD